MGFMNQGSKGVAVIVPAGTYIITQSLEIKHSNIVLRGAGVRLLRHWAAACLPASLPLPGGGVRALSANQQPPCHAPMHSLLPRYGPAPHCPLPCLQKGKTTLYFPKGLQKVYGASDTWAFGGAFLM